jgi:intracellular multiplication protein IcmX
MINIRKTILLCGLSFAMLSFASEYSASNSPAAEPDEASTSKYIKNLSAYLGYDVESENVPQPYDVLLEYTMSVASTGQAILNAFFASLPVNYLYKDFTSKSTYDTFNSQANYIYRDFTSDGSSSNVSVIENLDQKTYQEDPVSQFILNTIGTPDWSNCSSSSSDTCLSADKIMTTVLQDITKDGKLPGETSYYSYDNNSKFIGQLNSNTLISPLLYSADNSNISDTGMVSGNQLQGAQNFIRYVSESVIPLPTMTQSDYSTLFALAYPPTDDNGNIASNVDAENTMNARVGLAKYLLGLRVYAAKLSVPIGNLYYILGKRVAQTSSANGSSDTTTTSEALNEFKMATWRQFDPSKEPSEQWVQKINSASAATVQKEVALLLSDISTQLYQSRQIQERILLTNSILLIQALSLNKPEYGIPSDVDTGDSDSSS